MPRVSVITPTHDSADTVAAAMSSVRAQTFGDWEHVVVDDASLDDTAELVERAGRSEPRVRLVRSPANVGPALARNMGLADASGELVAFLDADDRLLPGYLSELVGLLDAAWAAGRRVGIVSCNAYLEGPEGRLPELYDDRYGDPNGAALTDLLRGNSVFIASLCPREAVDRAGGFSAECWGSEDHDLWLRILELGYEIVATRTPLVIYSLGENSISANAEGMARTTQATYRRALERGKLDMSQRRLARGSLRTARAAEAFERLARERNARGRPPVGDLVRALPLLALAAATQPGRWRHWARLLVTRTRGA